MLKWRSVEPTQGSYDWGPRDWLVGALASRGIRPVPFVWGSPEWVNPFSARPPVDTASNVQAWRNFLKAAVARYGPGGSYWANGYRQRFGPDATPLPIRSWQIWNEPNLSKYFDPGQTVGHAAQKYARLLEISHDAIKSRDPQARIVLAGMPGYGDSTAWKFLDSLYRVSGARKDFDAAALHPYARSLDQLDEQAEQFRAVMKSHGDRETPLWLTELAWGSGPSRPVRLQQGPHGPTGPALRRLQADPEPARRLERAAHLLVHVARSAGGLRLRGAVQHLRHGGARPPRPHPEARLPTRSRASRPRPPRRWRASSARRREASPRTSPRPSSLPRASPARPSNAAWLRTTSRAARRSSRARHCQTAPTPSTSARSTPPETRAPCGRGPSSSKPGPPR